MKLNEILKNEIEITVNKFYVKSGYYSNDEVQSYLAESSNLIRSSKTEYGEEQAFNDWCLGNAAKQVNS